jgi:pyrimidine-nucleoside phosphorylase
LEDAKQLATLMVAIGKLSGREVRAVLSDMNQPLGKAVGNAIELKEAIDTLNDHGPKDFLEHCFVIASHMLVLGKKADSLEKAKEIASHTLESGAAWEKFRELVITQQGDVSYIDHPEKLPNSPITLEIRSDQSGYISEVNARVIGETSVDLGAGRAKKTDSIDPAVGIIVHQKVGGKIENGDLLFTIFANDTQKAQNAEKRLKGCVKFSENICEPLPLFYSVIS